MAVVWKLARVGTGELKTLEEWQIKSAVRALVNQGRDTLTLGFGGSDLRGNSPFAPAEILRLDRVVDGVATTVFRGRVVSELRGAYGSTEGFSVQVAGPWWYLENLIFMQPDYFVTDPAANPVIVAPATELSAAAFPTTAKTSSIFTISVDDTRRTIDSREQILAAINYAIEKGAPIAIGTIDAGIAVPRDSIQDATCAEIILKSLRWTPGQTAYLDYSVNPPTINIRAAANRTALALDIANEVIAEVEVNPRRDLAVVGVTINYLRRHQRTNIEFTTLDKDQAGADPEGIGALVLTLELYGSYLVGGGNPNVNGGQQLIAAEAVPAGLAAALYAAYSVVPYEGRIQIVQDECDALSWTNRKLSIANGVPEWAPAAMLVQQATDDIFAGRTELTVGPPRQLGAQDLLGLVRKGRTKAPPVSSGYVPIIPTPSSPDFPNAGSGDPRIQFSPGNQPQVILNYFHGQDVGYPNSYGGFDGDIADVYQTAGGVSYQVTAASLGSGVTNVYGVRFAVAHQYLRREVPMPPAGIRNSGYPGSSNVVVLAYTNPITVN